MVLVVLMVALSGDLPALLQKDRKRVRVSAHLNGKNMAGFMRLNTVEKEAWKLDIKLSLRV